MSWRNTKDWQFHVSAGLRPTILMTRLFLKPYSTTSSSNRFNNQHTNLIHRSRDFSATSWHIATHCHIGASCTACGCACRHALCALRMRPGGGAWLRWLRWWWMDSGVWSRWNRSCGRSCWSPRTTHWALEGCFWHGSATPWREMATVIANWTDCEWWVNVKCSNILTYVECQLSTTELLNGQPFDIFQG